MVKVQNAFKDANYTPTGGSAGDLTIGSTIAEYAYDASGRRIRKDTYLGGERDNVQHFYCIGNSIIETRNGSDQVTQQHVWDNLAGHYIDSLAEVANNTNPGVDDDGCRVGCGMIQRLRRQLGLAIPKKKRKVRRGGVSTGLPTKATQRGHVWTWGFVHETTVRGGKLRMLNVIDEYTRECLCIDVARRINAEKVRQVLSYLIDLHGAPGHIRSDNGSEFIEGKLQAWLAGHKIKTIYIEPGSPWQNGYIESFNARLREECLNREQLWTLTEARVVLEDWRWKYNHVRPHRSLGYITPLAFAQKEGEGEASVPGCSSSRAIASLRHSLELPYHLDQLIHPARLTQALGQIE